MYSPQWHIMAFAIGLYMARICGTLKPISLRPRNRCDCLPADKLAHTNSAMVNHSRRADQQFDRLQMPDQYYFVQYAFCVKSIACLCAFGWKEYQSGLVRVYRCPIMELRKRHTLIRFLFENSIAGPLEICMCLNGHMNTFTLRY